MELFSSFVRIFIVGIYIRGYLSLIDVHFENKEGGFFIKPNFSRQQAQQQQLQLPLNELDGVAVTSGDNSVLSVDKFTIFQNSHPVSVRAIYGPFSTKQTVPARYIVPDPPPPPPSSVLTVVLNSSSATSSGNSKLESAPDGRHLEVSAHLVNHEIARDSPVLRVLFHMSGIDRTVRKYGKQQTVCVVLHVNFADQSPLTTTCMPSLDDGQCLGEITIPTRWWSPLPNLDLTKQQKSPRRVVQISYYVLEPKSDQQAEANDGEVQRKGDVCSSHLQIQPWTKIASIPLVNARSSYKELKMDDTLFTLIPTAPVYPRSKIFVPVYMRFQLKDNVIGFIIKGRVKSGLKIMEAQGRAPEYWNLSFTANSKNTAATVTAVLKEFPVVVYNRTTDQYVEEFNRNEKKVEEVFSWLLEVDQDSVGDVWNEEAHIVWIVHYVTYNSSPASYMSDVVSSKFESVGYVPSHPVETTAPAAMKNKLSLKAHHGKRADKIKHKIAVRFEIHKDITQAVLPVSKTWELINTALLTGKQVSQPMKIFVVNQSGKIADVTRQSTCHTEDDGVLKVTSSCSSVYVDGSEIRGSSNATILVKYETFTGTASFLVWMPEISELDIVVSDVKLSQIYDWVVPYSTFRYGKMKKRSVKNANEKMSENSEQKWSSKKYIRNMNSIPSDYVDGNKKNPSCKLKYQQALIDVYCRFKAVDHDTGLVSYLISRKTWFKITELVMRGIRVADPQVASLNGRIITGQNVGRTEVQIISPLTGRVLGSKEIRVVNDKVSITKLIVNIVSGLQLNIIPDGSGENIYIAETSITRKLSAQYQEGLLDIEIEFSDGNIIPVADINAADYSISVDSVSPEVVAFAPMLTSLHPRVIAVGEGKGNLLKVTLLLPETCRAEARLKDFVLVGTTAYIDVDFFDNEYAQKPPMFVQNDGDGIGVGNSHGFFGNNNANRDQKQIEQSSDLQDIINGIPQSNDIVKEAAVQARQHHGNKNNHYATAHHHSNSHIAPMEIGMYIILATFSFAIIVFFFSCIVYAYKYEPKNVDFQEDAPSTPFLTNGYRPLNQNSGSSNKAHNSQSREPTTTNVHDWVWLGRATLERASGLLVPSISINDRMRRGNKNNNWIRITSNPTYTPELNPDVDLNAESCFHNPNHINLSSEPRIDSTTYNKKSKLLLPRNTAMNDRRQRFSRSSVAIPYEAENKDRTNDDYKPPVPPHRNVIESTGTSENVTANSKETNNVNNLPHRHKHHRHHHHHHHHKNKASGDVSTNKTTNTYVLNKDAVDENASDRNNHCPDAEEIARVKFINSSENLSEIRKANIIGNPMFSLNKAKDDEDGCPLGIEDLGMDYRQIMEYFDNLKESTA